MEVKLATPPPPPPQKATPSEVIVRELQATEFHTMLELPPFDRLGIPDPRTSRIIVGQEAESGRIVAFWCLFSTVHVEPLWIHEDHRRKPGLARRLWGAVRDVLVQTKNKVAFGIISDDDLPSNLSMARRLGFQKLPGSLYFVTVQEKPPNGETVDVPLEHTAKES